jgi:hypothetical protein
LCEHYNESHAGLLDWPWKVFAARWVNLLRVAYEREEANEARDDDMAMNELRQAHHKRFG